MNIQYVGDGFVIDCHEHSVTVEGQRFDVRPKTFQLLLTLIENKDNIIDKSSLLDNIWHDVNVDEQVIFQSVAEIRKVFSGKKVIQTHPRKGYSWVEPIELSNSSTVTSPIEQHINSDANTSKYPFKLKLLLISLLLLTAVVSSSVYYVMQATTAQHSAQAQNTIFILPTKNNIQDKKFDWVSIGIMDTLITQAADHSKVMPLDYVLLSMRNVNMDRDYTTEQISRLFKITAAGIVVESEISRTLDQYQLIYKLHFTDQIIREVIFGNSVDELVSKLSNIIASITEYKTENKVERTPVSSTKFNHEIFVEAIALSQSGKSNAAIQLIKGLIAIEPNNVQAQKVLIDWLQYRENFQEALTISERLIGVADKLNIDKAGIYYRHAYNLFRLGDLDKAWFYTSLINKQLKIENNPYYNGFVLQLEGELHLVQNDLVEARKSFTQSLKQFESIYFSIGMTSIHCLLAETEKVAGNSEKSKQHIELAKKVVREYEIENLLPKFKIDLEM